MSEADDAEKSRRNRTEHHGIDFVNGTAQGWHFGVPEAFKVPLDIRSRIYVDREASNRLRHEAGKTAAEAPNLTVYKTLWTRGIPPALSFKEGDVFYYPHKVRALVWEKALQKLKASVIVKEAQPDDDSGKGGWVEYEASEFRDGEKISTVRGRITQKQFETLLRTGETDPSAYRQEQPEQDQPDLFAAT